MSDVVKMNTPKMREIIEDFKFFEASLTGVSQTLEVTSNALRLTAWVSLGAAAAAAAYIDRIQPHVKIVAEKMGELAEDLKGAVTAYETGDLSGSKRFM
jgi:type VII secretion system (Wss) protein ESAT-6